MKPIEVVVSRISEAKVLDVCRWCIKRAQGWRCGHFKETNDLKVVYADQPCTVDDWADCPCITNQTRPV